MTKIEEIDGTPQEVFEAIFRAAIGNPKGSQASTADKPQESTEVCNKGDDHKLSATA